MKPLRGCGGAGGAEPKTNAEVRGGPLPRAFGSVGGSGGGCVALRAVREAALVLVGEVGEVCVAAGTVGVMLRSARSFWVACTASLVGAGAGGSTGGGKVDDG